MVIVIQKRFRAGILQILKFCGKLRENHPNAEPSDCECCAKSVMILGMGWPACTVDWRESTDDQNLWFLVILARELRELQKSPGNHVQPSDSGDDQGQ